LTVSWSSAHDTLTAAPGGARLAVRLVPRARRDRIEGACDAADGKVALKVAVSAAPVDGKANVALCELVARSLGVSKSSVTLVAGAAARNKLLFVAGDFEILRARLGAALEAK
jgi:uncharacterized protein YggU (UPF0235/DUF167 family)